MRDPDSHAFAERYPDPHAEPDCDANPGANSEPPTDAYARPYGDADASPDSTAHPNTVRAWVERAARMRQGGRDHVPLHP